MSYNILLFFLLNVFCNEAKSTRRLEQIFSWKQVGYDYNGVLYTKDADYERKPDQVYFDQELLDSEKFFIQYNNIPIGFEKSGGRVFITVPRRRHGIPSTLNYVYFSEISENRAPLLKPYPDTNRSRSLVSVYRPRVDACGRLWAVDTGLLEVPGERKQVQTPAIVVFDLRTDKQILRYELKTTDLVNERISGGLTSITVDVNPKQCNDAFAYINDLATEGLIVYSMKQNDSWRVTHSTFAHEESALNFTVAGHVISWKDGLFSIALSDSDRNGNRRAYYHPLMSLNEYYIDTDVLKNKNNSDFNAGFQLLGTRGASTQSGSHDYHSQTKNLIFANVAQDAILCWNVDTPLNPENVAVIKQNHKDLVYISDLKVSGDDVWVLVNQMPRFVFSTLNTAEDNFFVIRGRVLDLIRGTACERPR